MSKIKLSTNRLTIGVYIQLPYKWAEHPFLFNQFQIKDQQLIDVLHALNFKHVFYIPEKSAMAPLPPATEKRETEVTAEIKKFIDNLWQTKKAGIEEQKTFRRKLRECENKFMQSLARVRAINFKLENQANQSFEEARELVLSLIDRLKSWDSKVLHLLNKGKKEDNYNTHAYYVTILSLNLGRALALSEQEMLHLGLGALFHDIGKNRVPEKVLSNRPKITNSENNAYKMHVRYAMDKTSNIQDFPEVVTEIINQHHEFLDGTGFPKKLQGEQINLLTQVVTIANEYENMCNPRDRHPTRTPYHALSKLYKTRGEQLNQKILGLLVKELGIYPPSSIVQLCNKKYALVVSRSDESILQPNVLTYDEQTPANEAAIISLSDNDLKIESIILPSKLPDEVKEYFTLLSPESY
jgi:putative nucleotidyltransferase with HDIG domain